MPAKKKVGSKHRAKNGAVYVITKRGARFISGPTKGRGRKKKGGSASTGGSAATGGSARVGGAARRKRRPKKRGGGIGLGRAARSANKGIDDGFKGVGRGLKRVKNQIGSWLH